MSIHSAVVPYVGPKKETGIGGDVPLLFLLKELEPRRSFPLDRGGPDAASLGQDTAVGLDFSWIRAVIGRQVVTVLHGTIAVAEGEAVSSYRRAG